MEKKLYISISITFQGEKHKSHFTIHEEIKKGLSLRDHGVRKHPVPLPSNRLKVSYRNSVCAFCKD